MSRPNRSNLEPIGRFARRSGIPVTQLRHLHQVGLLQPAFVDPESGYRYYAAAQRDAAEVIALLRSLDMPVRDIQALLADPSDANVKELLSAHRNRLEARMSQAEHRLEAIDRIVKEGKLLRKSHSDAREEFVSVQVENVVSQVPSAERWMELREKVPMAPANPQEVHVVTLVSADGERVPLWIGAFEGRAIQLHLEGIKTERPLTYDLMLEALEAHGARVVRADVLRVSDMTFFAQLVTASNGTERTFDCRPSDAINLALRSAAPIAVAKVVFDDVRSEEGSDIAP